MTDRLITLGLSGASAETRQAAEVAQLKRRLAALERSTASPPIGTVLPYAGAVPSTVQFAIDPSWGAQGLSEPYINSFIVGSIAQNPTYVFAVQFSGPQSTIGGVQVSCPINRITKTTGASAWLGNSGLEYYVGPSGGGTHDGIVSDAPTAFSKGNNLAADDTYVYYTQPSDTDADVRMIYRLGVTATTTGAEYGQCPSGRYIVELAVTPTGVGTRYLYAVLDDQSIHRTSLSTPLSWTKIYDAPAGSSITGLDVAGTSVPTDHTAGHLYISLNNNSIVRYNTASPAVLQETWNLTQTPYSVSASNSHLYFSSLSTTGRITVDTTPLSATSADIIEYDVLDLPYFYSARQVADKTGTALYYISGSHTTGKVADAELTNTVSAVVPDGYVACNGQSLSRAQYPDLFDVVSTTFGSPDADTFTVPGTQARVHAYVEGGTTSVPNASATPTVIPLDAEEYDTHSFHSQVSNTSRITIPTGLAGVYRFDAQIRFTSSTGAGVRGIGLLKNGAEQLEYAANTVATASSGLGRVRSSGLITLKAGDYIEIGASQSSGAALTCPAAHIWLELVEPTNKIIKY